MIPTPNALARWTSNRYLGRVAVAFAVLLLAINEIGYYTVERLAEQNALILEARTLADQVRLMALMMESAKRGYILTERDAYLEPYNTMNRQFEPLLQQVQKMADRYPEQGVRLEALVEAARRKKSEMVEVLERFRSGNRAGAVDLVMTEIGRETMVGINRIVDQIRQEESESYSRVEKLRARVRLWSRIGITGLVLLCVAAVFVVLRIGRARQLDRELHLKHLSAERDKFEAQVDKRTAELTDLAQHLQRVREDERGRLARELHDELGGLLTTAKLDIARVRKRVEGAGAEVAETIRHLGQTLDAGILLKRRIIEDLRPSSLDSLGLRRTLEILCNEFAQRSEIRVTADIADLNLEPDRALVIYRVVQEALTNIAKYAKANEVQVMLHQAGERVLLRVVDNGQGFDAQQERQGCHGLAGMRFRLRSCGGDFVLRSAPGQGTTIEATLPL